MVSASKARSLNVAAPIIFTPGISSRVSQHLFIFLTHIDGDPHVQQILEEHLHNACFSREFVYDYPDLVALAFRRFSQGVKVVVQIVIIAA